MMTISIMRNGEALASKSGEEEAYLVWMGTFEKGDTITLSGLEKSHYLIDLGMGRTIVYASGRDFSFPVPFDEKKQCYDQRLFTGNIPYM